MPEKQIQQLPDLIPARMLNEYAYCPRLCWLEWVEAEFADSADTVDGRYQHRRVDREQGSLADPDDDTAGEADGDGEKSAEPSVDDPVLTQARSVMMSDPGLGLIARIDMVEETAGVVVPVDVKRGAAPDLPEGAYEPERVQVCAQGLILRANGYSCVHGEIYFAQSRRRVTIPFDETLIARTLELLEQMRDMAKAGVRPPPLDASPKCPRCSLAPICLPDETNALLTGAAPAREDQVRRLTPARDDALPLYVQKHGAVVGKRGDRLVVSLRREIVQEARLMETSQVCLFSAAQMTTPALQQCLSRDIPVLYFSHGGWFYGMTHGLGHKNVEQRRAQYRAADAPPFCLELARDLIRVKILNGRTLLRRNHPDPPGKALEALKLSAERAAAASSLESLLGIEGMAAKTYFSFFGALLKPAPAADESAKAPQFTFAFEHRNRRPPRDPVNAMLSFAYALLTKDWTITLASVGFDPYLGFYHQPRYGRPALALDMMEPFRPLIPDSVVLWAVNNRVVAPGDFIRRGQGVALKDEARRKFILAYEKRMDALVTHPVFNYRISYRRVLEVQARLLARTLTGEIPRLPDFLTR
ncbi:MAG: CRISPR-associated endonuclease Cas4g/Cas1g [Candidatus Hydrogenedentales bacterium]